MFFSLLSIFVELSRASALSVLSDGSTNCGILSFRMGEHKECGDNGEHGKDGKYQPDDLKHSNYEDIHHDHDHDVIVSLGDISSELYGD